MVDIMKQVFIANPLAGLLPMLSFIAGGVAIIVLSSELAGWKPPFKLKDGYKELDENQKWKIRTILSNSVNTSWAFIKNVVVFILQAMWILTKDLFSFVISFFNDGEKRKFISSAFGTYFAWGTVQQILCVFLFIGLCKIFPTTEAMILTSMVFAVFHTPNFLLIFATFGMGQVYMNFWYDYHNVYLLGLAHGILGTTLKAFTPEELNHGFRIWKRFWK